MPILRTCLQLHSLHWPQLPYLRSLRHSGDIRPGWDPRPLFWCLRDDAGGHDPLSGPGHQARGSLRDLRPEPSPPPANEGSSPQLSPTSRIRRPMFTSDPIPGNVDLRAKDFHGEPYYDIPALTTDQRFRDSMRLIRQYSLLPFMTSRQFYCPRVVLEFYHTMTSQGVPSLLELRFSIDGRPGVLRAMDIIAAMGLPAALVKLCWIQSMAPAIIEI